MPELDRVSDTGTADRLGSTRGGIYRAGATLEEAASEKHYLMTAPKDGKPLQHLRFTRRRREKALFDAEDAGKTAYVCPRYENGKGEVGQWGPVTSIIIP